MEYANILLRPVISEKATMVKDAHNQVVFIVHPDANKIEIAKAVEKAFSVTVTGVTTSVSAASGPDANTAPRPRRARPRPNRAMVRTPCRVSPRAGGTPSPPGRSP